MYAHVCWMHMKARRQLFTSLTCLRQGLLCLLLLCAQSLLARPPVHFHLAVGSTELQTHSIHQACYVLSLHNTSLYLLSHQPSLLLNISCNTSHYPPHLPPYCPSPANWNQKVEMVKEDSCTGNCLLSCSTESQSLALRQNSGLHLLGTFFYFIVQDKCSLPWVSTTLKGGRGTDGFSLYEKIHNNVLYN